MDGLWPDDDNLFRDNDGGIVIQVLFAASIILLPDIFKVATTMYERVFGG